MTAPGPAGVAIDGTTRLYAVLGDPVAQVQTPRLINPIFAAACTGILAVPFHVRAGDLPGAWDAFRRMPNVAGIGVTVPHKIVACGLCDSLTDAARAVGAVNSIRRHPDGRMEGALFDGAGFVAGLGPLAARLRGGRILLLGAGGAGRAIAHALAQEGPAQVLVHDLDADAVSFTTDLIDRSAGRPLARAATPRDLAEAAAADVWINATPVGLKPGAALAVDPAGLRPDMLVADIAALDRETELLQAARARGCATCDGNAMLAAQIGLIAGFAEGLGAGRRLG